MNLSAWPPRLKKKEKYKDKFSRQVNIRLTREEYMQLTAAAAKEGITANALGRRLVVKGLKDV